MKETVFDFNEYRPYLQARLGGVGTRNGLKTKFSEWTEIKLSYLSQVLQERTHISLEQAEKGNEFLGHSEEESHFFLLIVQKDRAGTHRLKKYFEDQIKTFLKKRQVVKERIQMQDELKQEDRATYYSSWIYAAVHIAVTIPRFRQKNELSTLLGIPPKRLDQVLKFLIEAGLISENKGSYLPGIQQIHLTQNSPELTKHLVTWRHRSAEVIERMGLETSLHYSGVVSLSEEDFNKVKEILLQSLKKSIDVIKTSPEEKLCCLNLDFFGITIS